MVYLYMRRIGFMCADLGIQNIVVIFLCVLANVY